MDTTVVTLGSGALVFVACYLASMICIGLVGRRRRQSDSLEDYYLAGRSMGITVLFLTLYATQYSGNTMFGYAGRAYQIGFGWIVSSLFMFSIIVGYLLFAPRLVMLSRIRKFITPGDYITYRFGSRTLTLLSTVLMTYALANYTLAQLKAMGAAVEGITAGAVPSAYGIVALAIIMVIYETLGGMRSVAWTDVLQGIVLLVGFSVLLFLVPDLGGGLSQVVEDVARVEPEKMSAPSLASCNTWVSYIILIGCGAAVYPQAIQRLYASRSVQVLKRAFAFMAFMPLTTTTIAIICGITGIVLLPDLEAGETDQVLPRLCALVMAQSQLGYWLIVLVFAAALAALMSTADSALLSISSMITRDVYQPYIRPEADEFELTWVGKICSWIAVAVLIVVAISTEKTLVRLLELKFEVLVQVVPCFFFGLYWRYLSATSALVGILLGLIIALGLTLSGQPRVFGYHAGVVGLAANAAVCAGGTVSRWLAARSAVRQTY